MEDSFPQSGVTSQEKLKTPFLRRFGRTFSWLVIATIGLDLNSDILGYQIWSFINFPITND